MNARLEGSLLLCLPLAMVATGCGSAEGTTGTPATTSSSAAAPSAPVASGTQNNAPPQAGGCTKPWQDEDAVLAYQSMYETLRFDRKAKTITEKVGAWPAEKSVKLSDAEFGDLDGFLSGLCLASVTDEPPPPPGGPFMATIEGKSGKTRLGVKGSTGGSYLLLTSADDDALFKHWKALSPEMRDCLHFGPGTATIIGKLTTTTRSSDALKPGEKYALVLMDYVRCVADDKLGDGDPGKVSAQSVELVADAAHPLAKLMDKRVTATGKLSSTKRGDKTDVVMKVDSFAEAK